MYKMKNIKFLIFTIISIFSYLSFASEAKINKLKIVVSSDSIANMVRMLPTEAFIQILAPKNSCPHEYIIKPSDYKKVQESDIVIYTNSHFEPFMPQLIKGTKAKVIELSSALNVNEKNNMHLWMDPFYVKKAIDVIAKELQVSSLEANKQINHLQNYAYSKLTPIKDVLLLSDSLEYLFSDSQSTEVNHLYIKHGMTSTKDLLKLRKQKSTTCMIVSCQQKAQALTKSLGRNVVFVDSENWSPTNYKKIIDKVSKECDLDKY